MKKALSKAEMIGRESKAIRQTMKQGILNIQPLSVSIVETSLEERFPYAVVLDGQPSEPKIKSERLV